MSESSKDFSEFVDATYFVERIKELKELLANTDNLVMWEARKEVIDDIKHIVESSEDINEVVSRSLQEYEIFCAMWLNGDEVPLVPTPWQSDAASQVQNNPKSVMLCARKVGKSAFAASYILWECVAKENRHHVIFAPTKSQLRVMKDFYRHCRSHSLFKDGFVGGGKLAKTEVEFDVTSSSVEALNIGQHGNFDLKRGVAGNRFWVDEFAIVSEDARKELIDPLMREDIGGSIEKKMVLIGTPKLSHNPNLKEEVETAEESKTTGFIKVTAWEAMKQGIKSSEQMKKVFAEELNIECHWTKKYGACPQFVPEWFSGMEADDAHDGKCPCLKSEKFLMEEMAEFPHGEDRFIPTNWINLSGETYEYVTLQNANPNLTDYYMSVDVGLMSDPTAVLIGHKVFPDNDKPYLKFDYWEEVEPFTPSETTQRASERHIDRIKEIYHTFEPKQVFIDATKALDTVELICSGEDRVPRNRIYADETMENRDGVGIWWSNDRKTELYTNYKRMLEQNRIRVPGPKYESSFWQTWWDDHFSVEAEPTKSGNRLSFNKTGHTIDAAVMLNISLTSLNQSEPAMVFEWDVI